MWKYQNTDELYHYGILGMKWGIRRATNTFNNSNYSNDKKRKAVNSLMKHQTKITKKLNKLDKSDIKLNKQRQKQILSSQGKEIKYRQQAAKLRGKKYGIFTSKAKAEKLEFKATKLDVKAENIKQRIEMTKAKLAKNQKYRELYSKGLSDVNSLIKKGKKYLK